MDKDMVSLKINDDMIKGIVSKQMQQAIVKELGNAEEYMEALIATALHQQVTSNGDISNYARDNKYDYLDVLLKKEIQKAAKNALEEYIKENTELLKEAMKKELTKTASKNMLVNTFIEGATKAFKSSWGFNCNVDFDSREER